MSVVRSSVVLLALFLPSGPLRAADSDDPAGQTVGAVREPDRLALTMTVEDCRRLARHRPNAGVAYQPGVDVRGNAVAPADLTSAVDGASGEIRPPETIVIPIKIELFERFGIPANPDLFKAEALVGEVVYRDGKLTYNGQRLADNASDRIAVLCTEQLERGSARR